MINLDFLNLLKIYLSSLDKNTISNNLLKTYTKTQLYIHAPEDLPYVNHPQEEKFLLSWGVSFLLKYQVWTTIVFRYKNIIRL